MPILKTFGHQQDVTCKALAGVSGKGLRSALMEVSLDDSHPVSHEKQACAKAQKGLTRGAEDTSPRLDVMCCDLLLHSCQATDQTDQTVICRGAGVGERIKWIKTQVVTMALCI